jgi:putative membrane protein
MRASCRWKAAYHHDTLEIARNVRASTWRQVMNSRIVGGAALCVVAALGWAVASAQAPATSGATAKSTSVAHADRNFAQAAAEAGAAEVAMAKVAQQRGASADVKSFADRMVTDHQKAGAELASIAASKSLVVNDKLSSRDSRELGKLQKLDGTGFDREYVKVQLGAHKDAVKLFKKEADGGKDADLKNFATTTLPTLQDHLAMVTTISKTLQ